MKLHVEYFAKVATNSRMNLTIAKDLENLKGQCVAVLV